jgi:hypothetical protein
VVGREGTVVGVVAALPAGAEGRAATLGYGVVIPATTLEQIGQACDGLTDRVQRVRFTLTGDGFATAYEFAVGVGTRGDVYRGHVRITVSRLHAPARYHGLQSGGRVGFLRKGGA